MRKEFLYSNVWRGFTLIELVVTIAIVCILMGLAVPSYQSILAQARMAGELNDLLADVQLARSASMKQGLSVTICASTNPVASPPACSGNPNWERGWIVFIDVSNTQSYVAGLDTLLRTHPPFSGSDTLTGSLAASALATLTFNRVGGVDIGSENTAILTLHDSADTLNRRRCLVVTPTGMAQVNTQTQNRGVCP